MFRIKASYTGQLELKTTLERAREFFGELRNFADLMPGIEGIRKESGGIMRWIVRAEVPVIGSVQASFAVRKTEDRHLSAYNPAHDATRLLTNSFNARHQVCEVSEFAKKLAGSFQGGLQFQLPCI